MRFGLVVAAFAAISCSDATPRPVLIGLLALSGEYREVSGTPTLQGGQLAVDGINALGGVDIGGVRHHVEIRVKMHEDRPDAAASAARALINQEGVVALIGPQLSRHAVPAAVIANDAHIPMISPMSSSPATTAGRPYVFRLAFRDDFQGDVLARFAASRLNAATAAVLYDEAAAYSTGLANIFSARFADLGGRIIASKSFTTDRGDDFRQQLGEIAADPPDVLLLPNPLPFVETQMIEARDLGLNSVFLGGDNWDALHLMNVPEAEGAFVAHQWRPDVPTSAAEEFVATYRSVFRVEPRSTAAMTYDAFNLLLEAITASATVDPDSLAEAIRRIDNFEGATGVISFAGSNDPERSAVITRIGQGEYVIQEVIDPLPR